MKAPDKACLLCPGQPPICGNLCERYVGNLAASLTTIPAGAVILFNFG